MVATSGVLVLRSVCVSSSPPPAEVEDPPADGRPQSARKQIGHLGGGREGGMEGGSEVVRGNPQVKAVGPGDAR